MNSIFYGRYFCLCKKRGQLLDATVSVIFKVAPVFRRAADEERNHIGYALAAYSILGFIGNCAACNGSDAFNDILHLDGTRKNGYDITIQDIDDFLELEGGEWIGIHSAKVLAQLVRRILNADMECPGCLFFIGLYFKFFICDELHCVACVSCDCNELLCVAYVVCVACIACIACAYHLY